MKLSEFKAILNNLSNVQFILSNGSTVPKHVHLTEVGVSTKKFIDCGGIVRNEKAVNFQLWNANDVEHRLKSEKILQIIELSEKVLGVEDFEITVEYQSETIATYGLDFNGSNFVLINKKTNCLAKDQCGIPLEKQNTGIKLRKPLENCNAIGGSCC